MSSTLTKKNQEIQNGLELESHMFTEEHHFYIFFALALYVNTIEKKCY